MKRTVTRSTSGVCFVLLFLLQTIALAIPASAQTAEKARLPEYYGIYAYIDGKFCGINVPGCTISKERNQIRYGEHASNSEIYQGAQPVKVSTIEVWVLPTNIQFLVFAKTSGIISAETIAQHDLRLKRHAYVRNITIDILNVGGSFRQRIQSQENAWDSSFTWGRPLNLFLKPVKGESEMVLAVPSAPLKPGVYVLSGSTTRDFLFAVNPVEEGEQETCRDVVATVAYSILFSQSKSSACKDTAIAQPTPQPTQPTNAPPTPPQPSAPVEAQAVWDKALEAGEVSFIVYRERFASSQKGSLRLTPTEVSFIDQKGQKIFAVPPSDISSSKVFSTTPDGVGISSSWLEQHSLTLDSIPGVGLSIAGKNYNFEPFPLQAECELQYGFVLCPQPGRQQQSVIANYVAQTIPKLALGDFAKTAQPPTPKASCDAATDLGYSLLAGGHLYKVKGIASPSGGQVHVFFDEKGSPVQGQNLLEKLAMGAWARENVVALPSARADIQNAIQRVSGILGTSQALQRYEMIQDVLARAMTEAIEAAVTGGATLDKGIPSLGWSFVRSQLASPRAARTLFTLTSQIGLQRSLDKYNELKNWLPPADSTALEVDRLERVRDIYSQAQGFELPYEALAAALMPKSAHELTDQALQSMLSQLVGGLSDQKSSEAVTLASLLSLQKSLGALGQNLPALQAYNERLNLAINLAQANNRKIDAWATQAATACSH